ncbi:MAG: 23S rRNA pseudouridine(2604) synthase RluF [Sphingobacteriales bacterium]|nr:MAG: 23S rRNA pseudouridine(2604) synthase RluF [Sphingobacteriales bacterium]
MANEGISLNKFISSTGFCSRREADKLIEQARVSINGKLILHAARVQQGDSVEIDGEPIKRAKTQRPIYIAFNKPVGITSTTDTKDKTNIISAIDHPKRIFPIGRLDKESDGLIFLTNDGDIVNKILRAGNQHEKEYIVIVDQPITPEFIQQMGNGVPILGTVTRKCVVRQEGNKRFRIVLIQGLNRQIRRMCEHFGYKVTKLTRTRIMNITLSGLPVGHWRYFSLPEVDDMMKLVSESSKEDNYEREPIAPPKKKTVAPKPDKELPQQPPKPAKKKSYKDFRDKRKK